VTGTSIKAQGMTLHISSEDADVTAYASATFVKINGITTIPPIQSTRSEIDETDLDSTAKEYLSGLPDNGSFSPSGNAKDGDSGQEQVKDAFADANRRWLKITDSAGNIVYFKGLVLSFSDNEASVDALLKFEFTARISGAITRV
jgi:hypothetical protein